ncbi:hypothetical protein PPACK8108_LOCUS236 [Phakopsora pachyrhizi]|uniref:Uncharacterized protein n=1 Tax=Phakopsora pachyrhizi TaxID=170000 RepID=A0AAV0AEI4_PHAPC|nr:hypothetical protein PPACK8108_LOCUS236 [Phakopsora pachyrhizi]
MFLGDSPMHAEINSTLHPNPKTKKDKATGTYVDNFIGQNTNGILVKPNLRSWIDTKKNAYHTWYLVQRGAPKTQVQSCISEFGVKYVLNLTIIHTIKEKQDTKVTYNIRRLQDDSIEKLFNPFYELKGFDGHKDTPVEVLHVILLGIVKYLYCDLISGLTVDKKEELVAQFQSFEISNLNIPSIKAKYLVQHYSSLVGKDFKIIIQAAPFVFFTIIEESRQKIWISLCHLCSLIFQTHISCLENYVANPNSFTQDFLIKLISSNAQWVNKPKFHILLHLSQSVAHFGPASLFATEKFESYNGADIANSFMSFSAIRYCLSGGNCISETNVSIVSPSYQVKNLLLKNPTIQNLLGLDSYIFKVKPRRTLPKRLERQETDMMLNELQHNFRFNL